MQGRRILETALMVSVMVAYGISPAFAVEIEHEHDAVGDHYHDIFEWLFDCHDHPCDDHHDYHHDDHKPADSEEGGDCSHSHVIFSGSVGHAANWMAVSFPVPPGAMLVPRTEPRELCPEGPCYGLLKPPQ